MSSCPRNRSSTTGPARSSWPGSATRKREVVTFDEIPPILLDATTAIEDKTFWENAGFDPVAIISATLDSLRGNSRGASTITQQLVRARLLPSDLVQDPNRTAERKLKEIIQSIRVTQAFPGEEGKQEIITAYLNQNYYGNQSYGVKAAVESYFGKPFTTENITPAEAAIIAGAAEVAVELRPGPQRRSSSARSSVAEGRRVPAGKSRADRRPNSDDRRSAATTSSTCSPRATARRSPATQYRGGLPTPPSDDRSSSRARSTPRWIAPHFVWAVRDELTHEAVRPGRRDVHAARARRPARHDDPRRAPPGDRREVGRRPRRIVPHSEGPGSRRQGARVQELPGLDAEPREQERAQRRARRDGLPDRRARRVRRLGQLLRDERAARSSSRSTTSSATASASRARRSSRSTTRSASTTRSSPPGRC